MPLSRSSFVKGTFGFEQNSGSAVIFPRNSGLLRPSSWAPAISVDEVAVCPVVGLWEVTCIFLFRLLWVFSGILAFCRFCMICLVRCSLHFSCFSSWRATFHQCVSVLGRFVYKYALCLILSICSFLGSSCANAGAFHRTPCARAVAVSESLHLHACFRKSINHNKYFLISLPITRPLGFQSSGLISESSWEFGTVESTV